MKRAWLYPLFVLLLVVAGVAAFSLGRLLNAQAPAGSSSDGLSGTALDPVPLAEVTLENAAGDPVQMGDFNKPTLVYFGFTKCPDVCPLTMSRLASFYDKLAEPEALQVVMVTVDPTDTPEITNTYARSFNPNFIGLSGSNSQLAEAWQAFYIGARELEDGSYLHPDAVIVLDSDAQMRLIYGPASIPALETELETIVAQDW